MRIAALHLLAYGPFTNRSLEFGAGPGFHLIYGDNEAGKSTTLRALSSIMFGYPHEVVDGYQHDAKDIALAADLIGHNGELLSFQRRRRGRNALSLANGTPLEERAIAQMLGGTSQEVFESVFALDHHRLHEHAQALLSGGGSLSIALAAAGAGLAGLKASLDRLKAERAALFLPAGSKPTLNHRLSQLLDLRKEARRRQVSLPEYKKCQKEIDDVEATLSDARGTDRRLEAELAKLERIVRILPLRARHTAIVAELQELTSVPSLGADASEMRIKAESEREAAEADITEAEEAITTLTDAVSKIALDQAVLGKRTAIETLSQLRSSVESADASLPRRDAELTALYETVRELLANAEIVGEPTKLDSLLPSLVKRRQVLSLAEKGRALDTRTTAMTEQVGKAEKALQLAKDGLAATNEPRDTRVLSAALQAADMLGDIRADILDRARALSGKTRVSQENIAGLGLTSGGASRLRALSVPSDETVTRFRQRFTAIDAEENTLATGTAQLRQQLQDTERRIAELAHGVGAATREQLQATREARDAVWTVLRGIYVEKRSGLDDQAATLADDGDLAGTLEQRTAEADRTADAIIAHSKEAAELSLSMTQRSQLGKSLEDGKSKSEGIQTRRSALEAEWKTLWPADIAPIHPPAEMVSWLRRREAVLHEDLELQKDAAAIASLEAKEVEARAGLIDGLAAVAPVEPESSLSELRRLARGLVDIAVAESTRHAKALQARDFAEEIARDADAAHVQVRKDAASWSTNWQSALRNAGMNDGLTVDAAATILEIMTQLDALKPQIAQLTRRIVTMSNEVQAYKTAVAALGSLVADYSALSAIEISRQLDERLREATVNEAELRNLEAQKKLHDDTRRKAADRLRRSKLALEALCSTAGCKDASMLAEIEQRAGRKQQSQRACEELEARILDQGSGLSLDALLAECEGVDGDALPGTIADRRAERIDLAATIEPLMTQRAELRAAFDGLFGQSEAAESRQGAANVEADITSLAGRYVNLALQEVVLRQAIDLYRERNQGPILGRARALFNQLTNEAYSGLRADVDEKGEAILIAEHPVRGSLEVGALSDGTVDPLYLALRLAAVQEHNATREPLPFVADDLLLNLDNTRAQAALRVLGGVAEESQVLFFTHHEHMLALARANLPGTLLTEHRL